MWSAAMNCGPVDWFEPDLIRRFGWTPCSASWSWLSFLQECWECPEASYYMGFRWEWTRSTHDACPPNVTPTFPPLNIRPRHHLHYPRLLQPTMPCLYTLAVVPKDSLWFSAWLTSQSSSFSEAKITHRHTDKHVCACIATDVVR